MERLLNYGPHQITATVLNLMGQDLVRIKTIVNVHRVYCDVPAASAGDALKYLEQLDAKTAWGLLIG